MRHGLVAVIAAVAFVSAVPARAQNDWQFPDPYFGAFQHRYAGTPEAERRYRAEIAPQQPLRLYELRQSRAASGPRHRPSKQRARTR
ncbi:MAG: hypothetical protein ACKOYJ_00015 [Planctomycetia bacterium]